MIPESCRSSEKGRRLLPGESVIEEVGRQMSEEGVTREEGRLLTSTVEVLTGWYLRQFARTVTV